MYVISVFAVPGLVGPYRVRRTLGDLATEIVGFDSHEFPHSVQTMLGRKV